MKNNRLIVAASIAAVAALLGGCGSEATALEEPAVSCGGEPIAGLAVVQGNRSNTTTARLTALDCWFDAALQSGTLTGAVIIADGEPTLAWTDHLALDGDTLGARALSEAQEAFAAGMAEALTSPATEPEANLLDSILLAARSLDAVEGRAVIVVNDSLLSTAGPLNLTGGAMAASVEDLSEALAPYLAAAQADLTGIEVVLLAPAAELPQTALDEARRGQLLSLYTSVLEGLGAEVSTGAATTSVSPAEVTGVADLPPVSLVEFEQPQIVVTAACDVTVPEALVGFQPNTAAFLDPEAARLALGEVAHEIAACSGSVSVECTTSSAGTPEGRAATSQERATAVSSLLAAELGVPAESIAAIGLGSDSSYYVPDRLGDGSLDPVAAATNRSCHIRVA